MTVAPWTYRPLAIRADDIRTIVETEPFYNDTELDTISVWCQVEPRLETTEGGYQHVGVIRSAGIHDVDPRSDDTYISQLADEQRRELLDIIAAMGLTVTA